jgi:hypothetical protein
MPQIARGLLALYLTETVHFSPLNVSAREKKFGGKPSHRRGALLDKGGPRGFARASHFRYPQAAYRGVEQPSAERK